jgi:hypothetical protein
MIDAEFAEWVVAVIARWPNQRTIPDPSIEDRLDKNGQKMKLGETERGKLAWWKAKLEPYDGATVNVILRSFEDNRRTFPPWPDWYERLGPVAWTKTDPADPDCRMCYGDGILPIYEIKRARLGLYAIELTVPCLCTGSRHLRHQDKLQIKARRRRVAMRKEEHPEQACTYISLFVKEQVAHAHRLPAEWQAICERERDAMRERSAP